MSYFKASVAQQELVLMGNLARSLLIRRIDRLYNRLDSVLEDWILSKDSFQLIVDLKDVADAPISHVVQLVLIRNLLVLLIYLL